jgi:hypothetical protein
MMKMRISLVLVSLLLALPAAAAPRSKPAPAPAAKPDTGPQQGSLTVTGTPEAEIWVDGEKVSQTPLPLPLPMPLGEHTIKVAKVGYAPFIDVFKIKKGKETKVEVDLVPIAGIVSVTSTIPNARVFVDGKFVGEAPISSEIPIGAVAVQVSKGGYKDFFQNVMGVAGKVIKLDVKLEELPPEINPYVVKPPPPPKLYEKWWVWTAAIGGAAVLITAVVVPVTLATRDPINNFGAQYEFGVTVPVGN